LRSLAMQGAVSIEITEIIWICIVMGFFFKFGKQIEENNRIQYLTKLAYISVTRCCEQK
jgi:hypothetical protein